MATERSGLGLGQRLLLLGAWLVSCGFVYVLGVYVGKGMRGGVGMAPRVALPVEATEPPGPPADVQAPLTFYDVLGSRGRTGGAASATPPSTAGATPPAMPSGAVPAERSALAERRLEPPAPTPGEGGGPPAPASAPQRAAAPQPVRREPPRPAGDPAPLVRPTPVPAPAAVANVPVPPPAPATPSRAPAAPPAVPPVAATPPPVAATPPPTAAAPPAAAVTPPPAARPQPSGTGRWTVYANPTRDLLAAEHERAALRAKGYPAEVVTLRRDGDLWYRIRVGRYTTQAQAEEAARRLRSDGAAHGFVQSE